MEPFLAQRSQREGVRKWRVLNVQHLQVREPFQWADVLDLGLLQTELLEFGQTGERGQIADGRAVELKLRQFFHVLECSQVRDLRVTQVEPVEFRQVLERCDVFDLVQCCAQVDQLGQARDRGQIIESPWAEVEIAQFGQQGEDARVEPSHLGLSQVDAAHLLQIREREVSFGFFDLLSYLGFELGVHELHVWRFGTLDSVLLLFGLVLLDGRSGRGQGAGSQCGLGLRARLCCTGALDLFFLAACRRRNDRSDRKQ